MDLPPSTEVVEGTPSYPVKCSNFTSLQFWYLDLARGTSGAVALLVCSLILFLILLHKAYASLLQRFLLYLTLATWVTEATYTMQIEHLVKYAGQRDFCLTLAFLDQFGTSLVIVFSLEITLLLVCRVYEHLFLTYNSWPKCCRISLEVFAVLVAAVFSIATSVVPFFHGTYGLNGSWCWIIALNSDCKNKGFWDQNILAVIPYAILGLFIGLCIVFVIILFCISACQSSNSRRLNCKMIRDNLILMAFYLVFFIFCLVEVSVQFVSGITHSYTEYPVWFAYAVGFPVAELVLPLGFLFYMYTVKKLTLGTFEIIRNKCHTCSLYCKQKLSAQPEDDSTVGGNYVNVTRWPTYRSSHPQMYPSDTVISPPYTGAFTSITRRDSSDEGEKRALLSHRDTGYSSHYGTSEAGQK